MRLFFKLTLCLLICSGWLSCADNHRISSVATEGLRSGFVTPPDSIQTSVYWYWISGNISKEGVIKDLESMKQAGINRAFIGNIGLPANEAPMGPVKVFSDEWWEILHAALKKAGELGIDIGMFNCPGWSQSGGPWIEPGQAMRYLASTRTRVTGGQRVETVLPKPEGDFQDVRVIAFPYNGEEENRLTVGNSAVRSNPAIRGMEAMLDSDPATAAVFEDSRRYLIDITSKEPFVLRSLTVVPTDHPILSQAELQVRRNGQFETVAAFDINRTNSNIEVGFHPYAPIAVTVPATTGTEFRFILSGINPGSGIRELVLSSVPKVERYAEKTLAKMFQEPLPYWEEYQWRDQAPTDDPALNIDPARILDLTDRLSGDKLVWDAPEGEWTVLRTGMVPTGIENTPAADEGRGLEVDKMTDAYLQRHFDHFIGEVLRKIPAEDRKTFKVVVADSYEKGGQNFTDTFLEDFKARYGYDALPFLPVYEGYVVGSQEASDRFLWDLRRMVADNLSYKHIGALRDIAHQNGLTLWLENYGHWGFSGEFLQYGGQSDEIGGEFWSEGTLGDIENRAASSAAHIYGKTKVSAESFTCGFAAFSRYPATMRQRGDRFFSEGINNTLLHVYISQYADPVPPGLNAPFGNEFNRLNTWFPQLDLFTAYLKRSNYMLQQGLNVADVAYFIGEDAPKMTGITDPPLPPGYQFDYINAEVILNNLSVQDGLLTLPHGTQYRMLVLPKLKTMRPELLEKIASLVKQGAVILGPAPERSPSLENYPAADERVRALASDLWKEVDGGQVKSARVGKGWVMNGLTMTEALQLIDLTPDFRAPEDTPVLYGHRDLGDKQVYFVTNQSDRKIRFTGGFRVTGLEPEWWDAVDGSMRALPEWNDDGRVTSVPVELEAYQSAFIVFLSPTERKPAGSAPKNFPEPAVIATVTTPWTLQFQTERRGPADAVMMESLEDLSKNSNESIRYYSGTIRYRNRFTVDTVPETGRVYLDLGEAAVMAKVTLNGQYAGGAWTPPYRVDITEYLQTGTNEVEIEVVNTWVNRLIGDSRLPEAERKTYANQNPWHPGSELQKSGLIGPVTIYRLD